jgi:hypothetical protein
MVTTPTSWGGFAPPGGPVTPCGAELQAARTREPIETTAHERRREWVNIDLMGALQKQAADNDIHHLLHQD